MKIKTIEIHNYKAFYGDQNKIEAGGKNLFIYGENGSGKTSLYYALKDFFQSSMETIDLKEVENIFIDPARKDNVKVRLTFNPDENDAAKDQILELSSTTSPNENVNIRDAYQLRGFLNYKHLLAIHHIEKEGEIDLFDLLVKGVLKHFRITGLTQSLGEAWEEIENLLKQETSTGYNITQKRKDLGNRLGIFNTAFKTLFTAPTKTFPNPDFILTHANAILAEFDVDLKISLDYLTAALDPQDPQASRVNGGKVKIEIEYGGKKISKPHLFLNEARLSAIAISIYLGMIKRLPQLRKLKLLFLDDLFIGLDLSNRMPLLRVLERDFSDYQIIISTYDKPWYEVMKFYLEGNSDWKCLEFLARKNQYGYNQPFIRYNDDGKQGKHVSRAIAIAEAYYNQGDNKAAGVYLRSAFEFILKRYCKGKKLQVRYEIDLSKHTTEDFWTAIKDFKASEDIRVGVDLSNKCKLRSKTISDVELCRRFVLNPLCHQDQTKHESSAEIQMAVDVIKKLDQELSLFGKGI